jgi:hypothetical protein
MIRHLTDLSRLLGLLLIGLAARTVIPAITHAQGAVTTEVVPRSIDVPENDAAQARLILRNRTPDTLASIAITPVTNTRTKIEIAPAFDSSARVEPGGDLVWNVSVSRGAADPVDGDVNLEIHYRQLRHESPGGLPQVAYTTLQVKRLDLADLADVKIETTLDALDQQHPGKIYLVITNKSSQSITVRDVRGSVPGFITIDTQQVRDSIRANPAAFTFLPHQTGAIPIAVEAASRVQPGTHLLVFTIDLGWGKNGQTGRRSVVATRSINVGVFGESVLVKVLAIPSILLMPGVLILVVWGLLWKWGVLKWKKDLGQFPVDVSSPVSLQFWVVSISISIVAVAFYMWTFNNVLALYGLADLVWLWLLSVFVFGAGVYLAGALIRRWYLHRVTPGAADTPVDILRKLGRRDRSMRLEQREFKVAGDKTVMLYLLTPVDDRITTVWAAPAIELRWLKPQTNANAAASRELKKGIEAILEPDGNGDAEELATLLSKAEKAAYVALRWLPAGNISTPVELERASLGEKRVQPTPIVRISDD